MARYSTSSTVAAIFEVFLIGSTVPAASAVLDPELRIVIRTYDASTVTGELAAAGSVAAAILEDGGVGVTWVSCEVAFVERNSNPCLSPLAANELSIRFVRLPRPLAERDPMTLGESLIDTGLRSGSLATIYVNRVSHLAALCRVDMATLLGRAVAHEIGHLLLGNAGHAAAGLMRASWSQKTLRRAIAGDWTFTAADASEVREGVRIRNARRIAAVSSGQ
jgi:hypothetical protein